MSTLIISLLSSIVADLTANFVTRLPNPLMFMPRRTTTGYLHYLGQKIKEMPFIYEDLDGEVLNDFVDVEIQNLDLGTFKLQAVKNFSITDDEKLKRNTRVLFIGNAGIGKTTFQRRSILTLIKRRHSFINRQDKIKFLNEFERPIPIYVPLKAVDNSRPLPVLRYLLKSTPLLSHRSGLRRLIKLAKQRRLFLLLDGYDEIPFTGDGTNFVQMELENIIFPPAPYLAQVIGIDNPEHRLFYQSLEGCRVWLSSRREFFEQNPVSDLGTGFKKASEGLVAVELKGIGNNRYRLAEKIFDKYRKRSNVYANILSEEYFLNDIDRLKDDDLKKFSFNPLFLTVMCYVYVKKAAEERSFKVAWVNNFEELILSCVDLLLYELDEIKARDLPEGKKAALLERRNAFYDEKKLFLKYFASQLFFEGKSIFTVEYLKSKIKEFFTNDYSKPISHHIIGGLSSSDPKENIALQLTNQGVFVIVDKNEAGTLYDFPHRRFREVLASYYIATPERYELLLANIDKKQFTEFLKVFFDSGGFKDHLFQEQSLTHILYKAKGKIENDYFQQLTYQFMIRKPNDYDPNTSIKRFLAECLNSSTVFKLSVEILRNFKPDELFQIELLDFFYESIDKKDSRLLTLCCALLEFYNKALLLELLRNKVSEYTVENQIFPVFLQYLLRNDYALTISCLSSIVSCPEAFKHFCNAISYHFQPDRKNTKDADDEVFLKQLSSHLDRRQKLILFFFLHRYNPTVYAKYKHQFTPEVDEELYNYARITDRKYIQSEGQSDVWNYQMIIDATMSSLTEAAVVKIMPLILYDEVKSDGAEVTVGNEQHDGEVTRSYHWLSSTEELIEGVVADLQDYKYKPCRSDEYHKLINNFVSKIGKKLRAGGLFREYERIPVEKRQAQQMSITDFEKSLVEVILNNSNFCYIPTEKSISEIKNAIEQRCPIVISNLNKRRQTVYANFNNLNGLTNDLTRELEAFKYRVFALPDFESVIEKVIENALANLVSATKFETNVSQSKIPQNREITLRNLAKEIKRIIQRNSVFSAPIVAEVEEALCGFEYSPPPLITLFR